MFVAIPPGASTDTYITSEDGATWDVRTLPIAGGWYDIIHTGTVFFVIGYRNGSWTDLVALQSVDGVNWSTIALPVTGNGGPWNAVAWNGSAFCAISTGFPDRVMTSATGTAWGTPVDLGYGTNSVLASGGGVFCTPAGDDVDPITITSPDGITWTSHALPSNLLGVETQMPMTWGGGKFCAISSVYSSWPDPRAVTSPDGATWAYHSLPAGSGFTNLVWAGDFFCAIPSLSRSTEAHTFVTNEDTAMTSPDGAVWTPHTLPRIEKWSGAAWDGNVICVVGDNYHALTSPDGATWTEQTLPLDRATWIMAASGGVVPGFWKNFRRSIEL